MSRMKRKQIYLEGCQDQRLRAAARRRGKTESQLIREGVERILNEPAPLALDHGAWEQERKFIESWIRKGPVKGKRTWKREDLYER